MRGSRSTRSISASVTPCQRGARGATRSPAARLAEATAPQMQHNLMLLRCPTACVACNERKNQSYQAIAGYWCWDGDGLGQ